jgi:DNA primase
MNSPVLKIKERLSIVDVISSYLSIEKAGKNYKAKCPFHNEKTPSFSISEERGIYYCFGCGAKGDIFSFVEKFEGTDFKGSLKILADRAGIPLVEYKSKEKDKTDIYYEILEEATSFFEYNFSKNIEARSYLLNRGLNDLSIKSFRIGYALESWTSLYDYLIKKGYKKEDIEIVGLIKRKDERFYDRFRSRIIFPISDSSGRIIAFSGRIFKKTGSESNIEEAKYLNSPDTPLFNKSNVLFGLDKAKSSIRSRDYSIVVEGQMDLILSHQAGFTNTVAVSGTAFTDTTIDNPLRRGGSSEASEAKINNLGLVRRLSSNIIFAYDGDDAGIRAASRSSAIALSLDMQVKVASLPKGNDPADIIFLDINKWKEIVKNSKNIISFHLDRICNSSNDIRVRGKSIRDIIFPFLVMINSEIEKSSYINEIHNRTGISESAIIEDYKKYEKIHTIPNTNSLKNIENKDIISRRSSLEKKLFSIIFWKNLNEDDLKKIEGLKSSFEKEIGEDNFKKMFDLYEPYKENLSMEAEMWYSDKIDVLFLDMKEVILNLEEEIFKEEASDLLLRINDKEKNNKKEDINSDLITYQKIVEKIQNIKNSRSK